MRRLARPLAVGAALVALGATLAAPAGADNRQYVRDSIIESQALLGDVEAARAQFATGLGTAPPGGRPDPSREPMGNQGAFNQQLGGSMHRVGAKMRKLSEGRQRAEKTLSPKEAQFTAEVHRDLLRIVQQLSRSRLMVTESPDRRTLFFEDIGRHAEAVRRKLREYQ